MSKQRKIKKRDVEERRKQKLKSEATKLGFKLVPA